MTLKPEEIELYNACKNMEKCLLYLRSHKHDTKALRYYYKYLKMAIDKLEKSGLLGDENKEKELIKLCICNSTKPFTAEDVYKQFPTADRQLVLDIIDGCINDGVVSVNADAKFVSNYRTNR